MISQTFTPSPPPLRGEGMRQRAPIPSSAQRGRVMAGALLTVRQCLPCSNCTLKKWLASVHTSVTCRSAMCASAVKVSNVYL